MKHNNIIFIKEIADNFKHLYEHREEQEQVAWWLLQAITSQSKAILIAHQDFELTQEQEQRLFQWIEQHKKKLKPLQYILGSVPFCNLDILVEPPILIPRPETEEWCCDLIQKLTTLSNQSLKILDLCTGSGCIALALAKAIPQAHILATDISEKALALAEKNANYNTINTVAFIKSDVYDQIPDQYRFELIVANPPYIAPQEWDQLSPMVRTWEDKAALVAQDEGLAIIKQIINGAPKFLIPHREFTSLSIPQLVIEIGHSQGQAVKNLMHNAGFNHIIIKQDLAGKDRLVMGTIS